MSVMVLEHIPRLMEIARLSGDRGNIVMQSIVGLLPEYAGIGVIVGLYLSVALSVRKLALRGELVAIEAAGIGPMSWVKMPASLALASALFVLANQGWIMPAGEKRLADIGHRMATGEFGYNLNAREFTDLGGGIMLYFDAIDDGGTLQGIFLRDQDRSYHAKRGTLALLHDGGGMVELNEGRSLTQDARAVFGFQRFVYRIPPRDTATRETMDQLETLRRSTLPTLMHSPDPRARAMAYSRILWSWLAAVTLVLALVCGRPPMRSTNSIGVFIGLCLLVTLIKSIAMVEGISGGQPGLIAGFVAAIWCTVAAMLLALQRVHGPGAIDSFFGNISSKLAAKIKKREKGADC